MVENLRHLVGCRCLSDEDSCSVSKMYFLWSGTKTNQITAHFPDIGDLFSPDMHLHHVGTTEATRRQTTLTPTISEVLHRQAAANVTEPKVLCFNLGPSASWR